MAETALRHDQIDRQGREIQKIINEEIAAGFPTWSHFAIRAAADEIIERHTQGVWEFIYLRSLDGGPPQIRITQYCGDIA